MAVNIGPRIGIDGEAEYRRQINDITQAQKALAAEMKATESAFGKNTSAQEKNAARSKNLSQQVELQKKKVDELKKGLEQATRTFGQDSQEVSRWRQAVANAETELNRLNSELERTTPSVGDRLQEVGGRISAVGNGIKSVGDTMTKYVSGPILAVGAAAVKSAAEFEDAMAKVQTIADTTSVPMEDLENSILDLSDETGIAASDIAEAVYNAISAGQDTANAVGFVETATKLAKAGFTDTASSLDVLTSIMNAYGMESDKVTDVSDKLITVQNRGKTTIAQLSSSMGKIIPTASAFGVDLDNVASAYVVLTKNGISTAESTTYLNSMINELGKSGTKASKALKDKTGKSFKEIMDDGGDLSSVLKILEESAADSGVSLADMFGSAEAGKAALSILSDGGEEFTASMQAMTDAAGSTSEAFDTVSGTSSAKMQKSMNQLKNVAIKAGKDLLSIAAPGIEAVGRKIGELSKWYNSLDADTQRMVSKVGIALGVGGPLLSGVGSMISGIGSGISTVGSLLNSIGGISTAAGPVAGAIAALGALAAAWYFTPIERIEGYDDFMNDLDAINRKVEEIDQASDEAGKAISKIMDGADFDSKPIEEIYSQLKDCFDESGNLKEGMETTAAYLVGEFNQQMGTDFSTEFGNNAKKNLEQLAAMNTGLETYIENLKKAAVQKAFDEQFGDAVLRQTRALQAEEEAHQAYNKAIADSTAANQEYAKANADAVAEMNQWGTLSLETMAKLGDLRDAVDDNAAKVEAAGQTWANAGGEAEQAGKQVEMMQEAISAIASGDTEKGVKIMASLEETSAKAGDALKKKLAPGFKYVVDQIKNWAPKAYLEDIEAPKLIPPKVAPIGKEIVNDMTDFFASHSPTLSLRKSKVVGASEKGNEAKGIIERSMQNLAARIGMVNNTSGAASSAWSNMQSIIGRGMTGNVSSVSFADAVQSAWSSMQSWFNNNPLTSYVNQVVNTVRNAVTKITNPWGWANGGIVDKPTWGVFGEAGPEAFIPLSASKRGRAIDLYHQVGSILGVGSGGNMTNNTNNNHISINVYASANQSADEIAEIVSRKISAQVYSRKAVFT